MKLFDIRAFGRRSLVSVLALGGAIAAFGSVSADTDEISLRASGLVSTHKYHVALERKFYESLADKTGHAFSVNYNPLDVLGVAMKDTLRLGRKGTFDIVQSTVGEAARDDPFLEGLDLPAGLQRGEMLASETAPVSFRRTWRAACGRSRLRTGLSQLCSPEVPGRMCAGRGEESQPTTASR